MLSGGPTFQIEPTAEEAAADMAVKQEVMKFQRSVSTYDSVFTNFSLSFYSVKKQKNGRYTLRLNCVVTDLQLHSKLFNLRSKWGDYN